MIRTTNLNQGEKLYMIDQEYRNWIVKHWSIHGGLIPQAQAAKLLGKTPTRIRQMINENKIKSFAYKEESPLVSFAEIMSIFNEEEQRLEDEYLNQMSESDYAEAEYLKQKAKEENEEAYQEYLASLTDEEREDFFLMNEQKKQNKIKYHILQEQKEKLEEEMAQIQLEEQNPFQ